MGLTAAVAAAGLAASLAVAGAPTHAGTITIPDDGVLHERLVRICDRVPHLIERAEKVQPILGADADTRGSLKYLAARVARAKADGRPRVAQRLQRRLDRRTALAAKLPTLLPKLKEAQSECAAAGLSPARAATPSATGTTTS